MKKVILLFLASVFVFSLSACGDAKTETAKSADLRAQYAFYDSSVKKIISAMEITPEQADEVLIALVSSGLDDEISSVYKNGLVENTYSYSWKGSALTNDILVNNGVVEKVTSAGNVIYPESEVKAQEDAKAAEEEAEKENAKTAAILIDSQAFQIVLNSEEIVSLLQQGVDAISDGGGSALDLYDLAKTAKESQFKLDSSLSDLENKDNANYIDACRAYVVNGQIFAESLMKYLDEDKLEYLSDAKKCIADSETYILSVVAERSVYLSDQGVSDEDISSILQSESAPTE